MVKYTGMKQQTVIRLIHERDIEVVGRLWYELSLYHEPYHAYYEVKKDSKGQLVSHVRDLLHRDCIVYVAEEEGAVVGFVTGYIIRRNPQLLVERVGKVDNIFVSESCRGLGIGRSLLERLFSHYKDQRVKFIEISCDVENVQALQLYKRLGFQEQKVMLIKKQ